MTGICVAIGEPWIQIAKVSCARMEAMTGVRCLVISEDFNTVHPSWNKTRIVELTDGREGIMMFDADVICLRPWSPVDLWEKHNRAFLAVLDRNNDRVEDECIKYGIPFPDVYINAGLTIFGAEHKPIWESVWKMHPFVKGWLEQTPLNIVLQRYEKDGGEVVRLDRKYNQIVGWQSVKRHMAGDTVNAHIAGNGQHPERLLAAQKEAGL